MTEQAAMEQAQERILQGKHLRSGQPRKRKEKTSKQTGKQLQSVWEKKESFFKSGPFSAQLSITWVVDIGAFKNAPGIRKQQKKTFKCK